MSCSGPETLSKHEDCWKTEMGAWFPEERAVLRGKDIFNDLGRLPWMAVFLYAITGKMFDEKQVTLFDRLWVLVTSYPDPRIWPNRISSLAGTARSTGILAMSSSIAAFESEILGGRASLRSADFLVRTKEQLDQGEFLEKLVKQELRKYRAIAGYGRPISTNDERVAPVMKLAKELGFDRGEYVELAFEVQACLSKLYPFQATINMTIASLVAALTLDQGMTPRESYHYISICASVGMKACYIDAAEKEEGTFLPLKCNRINYTGKPIRKWE